MTATTIAPEEARTLLEARLSLLDDEDRLGAEAASPVTLDQASVGRLSRIDAMQVQAMALAAQRRRTIERNRIDAAFQRLATGEFGTCVVCGEPIADARLRNSPSVATCIDCARQA